MAPQRIFRDGEGGGFFVLDNDAYFLINDN